MRRHLKPVSWLGFLIALTLCACEVQRPGAAAGDIDALSLKEPGIEILEGRDITKGDVIGELRINFPLKPESGQNNLVEVSIDVPEGLAALDPATLKTSLIPLNAPPVIVETGEAQAYIPVREKMSLELSAAAFRPQSSSPSMQMVNLQSGSEPTHWVWNLEPLPDKSGEQLLTIRVNRGNEFVPIWSRTYQVEIVEHAPITTTTVISTSNQAPQFGQSPAHFTENWLIVFLILTALPLIFYILYLRPKLLFTALLSDEFDEEGKATPKLTGVVVFALIGVIWMIYVGWAGLAPNWTGLGDYINPADPTDYQPPKTLWNWMELLVIPIVLFGVGTWLNATTRESERKIERNRLRENSLQTYFDQMTELLLERGLRKSELDSEVRDVARARTLAVLPGLDNTRKRVLLRFLYEANLFDKVAPILDLAEANFRHVDLHNTILMDVDLKGIDMSYANLESVSFNGADLQEIILCGANLRGANLSHANLRGADLTSTNLQGSQLIETNLRAARLGKAQLEEADLRGANLTRADLSEANLENANLLGANLFGANLKGANLHKAQVSNRQLSQLVVLEGAIMPDASKYINATLTPLLLKK